MKIKQNISLLLSVGVFSVLVSIAPTSTQAATCEITRDLQMSVTGDDVLCLQKYLNGNGFVIAKTGAGAPGKETGEYKALTQAAVIAWQKANNISPAQGHFGPRSLAVFKSLLSGTSLPATSGATASTNGSALVEQLLAQVNALKAKANPVTQEATNKVAEVSTSTPATAKLMLKVLDAIDMANEAVDESSDDDAIEEAEDVLLKANKDLFAGLRSYLNNDFAKADKRLNSALSLVNEAVDALEEGGSNNVEDMLDEAKDELADARDEVEEAIDDDEDVGDAEDLLDEAEDLLDDAEDAIDDEDEAEDLIDEALDLIEEALGEW